MKLRKFLEMVFSSVLFFSMGVFILLLFLYFWELYLELPFWGLFILFLPIGISGIGLGVVQILEYYYSIEESFD